MKAAIILLTIAVVKALELAWTIFVIVLAIYVAKVLL